MKRHTSALIAFILAGLMAAPTVSKDQPPFCAALAMRDCAPWDGPAFRVFVSEPGQTTPNREASWLEIALWRTPDIKRATTITFPDQGGKVGLVIFEGSASPGVSGTVTFRKAAWGEDVEAEFDFRALDGRHVTGRFRAPWLDDVPLCG